MKKFNFGGDEFAARILPSALSILLSLGLLCTTSLAYFTETVTSRSNVIASASYWLEVEKVTPQSTAAEPSMIMADFAGEETTAQTPAVEEEYTPEESESGVAPAAESGVVPAAESGVAPAAESGVAPAAESDIPEVNAQTGITTTISTASSSKNSNALHDEESYEVVDAGISADAVSILTASLTEEEAAEDGGAEPEPITFNYTAAGLYYFEITAHGTAQTGYCKISIGDKSYYTAQIAPGSENSITLCIAVGAPSTDAGSTIEFTAQWGTSANYADENPTVILYDGTEGKDTIVACTEELYKTLLNAASDETDDDEIADDTGADVGEDNGDDTGVDVGEDNGDDPGVTSGETQGGGDAIPTVDAAA